MNAQMQEKVRNMLSNDSRELFDDIVEQRVLGAGKHIMMIKQILEDYANCSLLCGDSSAKIVEGIDLIADYFIQTRGVASNAINNAIMLMTKNMKDISYNEPQKTVEHILSSTSQYQKNALEAVDSLTHYAVELSKKFKTIMVFDYSSTVEKFLIRLKKEYDMQREVIIPESRIINGGAPYLKSCIENHYRVRFIPDASIMFYLKECDACYMGAETFLADGTGYNTTGSDIVALVCDYYKIPLYFLTPLIKLDIRSIYGYEKPHVMQDLSQKFYSELHLDSSFESVDCSTPELLGVDSKFITSYITEKGIIPANQMYEVSLRYYKYLKGDSDE